MPFIALERTNCPQFFCKRWIKMRFTALFQCAYGVLRFTPSSSAITRQGKPDALSQTSFRSSSFSQFSQRMHSTMRSTESADGCCNRGPRPFRVIHLPAVRVELRPVGGVPEMDSRRHPSCHQPSLPIALSEFFDRVHGFPPWRTRAFFQISSVRGNFQIPPLLIYK